jgi:hypothetical protein
MFRVLICWVNARQRLHAEGLQKQQPPIS